MKREIFSSIVLLFYIFLPSQRSEGQIPIAEIIKEGITKVIVAVDLKVQRMQNEVIWLQSAQKVIENTMSKIQLDEINEWMEKQKTLYADYFDELRKVKSALTQYHRVKEVISQQFQIVKEYKTAWELFRKDKYFTGAELEHILDVFNGMMKESEKSIDRLGLVINSFVTQMSDAERLAIINDVAENVQQILFDLRRFNEENKMISIQRATELNEIEYVRRLYGF